MGHRAEGMGQGAGIEPHAPCSLLYALSGVGEHCGGRRRYTVRSAGGATSDYADMSNDKAGENPARRKPKVSWVKFVCPGLVGP